jgi:hypothetical protein
MNQAHPPTTRRETIHGGSTPASMRVMVVDRCPQFMSLTVNETAAMISMYKTVIMDSHKNQLPGFSFGLWFFC